jgi:hypothetical protein
VAGSRQCQPADWSPHSLAPLLKRGKSPNAAWPDRENQGRWLFYDCVDSLEARSQPGAAEVVDGIEIRLVSIGPATESRRKWPGKQCTFDVRLHDGSGRLVHLGVAEIPPFNTVSSVVRAGSAVWLSVAFNGYTDSFPEGGNYILAIDLCEGRVVWKSKGSTARGGLLLLGDYLVSPFGFTTERRYVHVLDAHTGDVVQKLPVVENVCPAKRWADQWHPGERCDAPGQAVGAARSPRIEGGLFYVDTNTGSSTFEFLPPAPPSDEPRK